MISFHFLLTSLFNIYYLHTILREVILSSFFFGFHFFILLLPFWEICALFFLSILYWYYFHFWYHQLNFQELFYSILYIFIESISSLISLRWVIYFWSFILPPWSLFLLFCCCFLIFQLRILHESSDNSDNSWLHAHG